MDASARAGFNALTALLALCEVDVSEVAAHLDSLERAGLEALLTADATHIAVLHCDGTFLGVVARHIHTAVVLALGTNLDDTTRTSLGTSATAHAFVFVNFRKTSFFINVESVEPAFLHAVAQT